MNHFEKLPVNAGEKNLFRGKVTVQLDTEPLKMGVLCVDEAKLFFYHVETTKGFSLDYPAIMCHAICLANVCDDAATGGYIYCQFDPDLEAVHASMRIAAVDANDDMLNEIYGAISTAQALHPDPLCEEGDPFASSDGELYTAENLPFDVPDPANYTH